MTDLSWALTIATKDRLEVLMRCVDLALGQTLPPREIVIADASADWESHAAEIRALVAARLPELPVTYLRADAPSLTVQRNQVAEAATSDILFMIDDDSLMYPTCAEEIMRVYAADSDGKVAGVQASEAPRQPGVEAGAARTDTVDLAQARKKSRGLRWVLSRVLMMNKTEVFIPYDKVFHTGAVPAALKRFKVVPATLFGGFRMTFRRRAVLAAPFDGALRYYCPGEDLDGSYRISRHGILLTAHSARLHHYVAASGRLDRRQVAHLWSLNQAVLLRRHAADQAWARRAYTAKMAHRIAADLVKDLLMRRFSCPQMRGSLAAWRQSRAIWRMDPQSLDSWYPERQAEIVGR